MTIELNERTLGIWYVQLEPTQDWLCSIYTTEEGELKATYRFRYYVDDKAFDSDDKKNWYTLTSTDTISGTVKKFQGLYNALCEKSGGEGHEVLMDENGIDDFMERFKKLPFMNSIELSANEAKWMGYGPKN